jgi:Uma2 family endonuclease
MQSEIRPITTAQFLEFVQRTENVETLYELIGGEIVEVPSNPYSSFIAGIILTALMNFVLKHKLGYVTGAAGGYMVSGDHYAPDVAFISKEKQPQLATDGYNPNPPDLAVEVISSNRADELDRLRIKINNYLAAGTVVWVVQPVSKQVEVYISGKPVKIYREGQTIPGGLVLADFKLAVNDIFIEM